MDNAIKELRAVYGWTQADLAALTGVSRQSINAIETGKFDPSLPVAFAIGRVFGLPVETIFSDADDEAADEIGEDPAGVAGPDRDDHDPGQAHGGHPDAATGDSTQEP